MNSKVIFAGAGPGAVDLITLRARTALEQADVIIYAGSLVNPELLDFARPDAERHNSAAMSLDEVIAVMREAATAGRQIVRLHTGDPSVYGAISEQMNRLDELGIEYEVIPGVSSVFAAAAALKCELTMPGIGQSVILTRQAGRTPVPEAESISRLAANGASVAVFLSAGDMEKLVDEFLQAGRKPETPAAVVYRASWPNQKIVRGTLADIAERVRDAGIKRQAMIIVGEALARTGDISQLYADTFAHGYRDPSGGDEPRVALYSLTPAGALKAAEIAGGLRRAELFSARGGGTADHPFAPHQLKELIADNWRRYDAHVFVMAAGIVCRKVAPLLADKTSDPAVVVCDERGDYAISLLGGHLGGANRLARKIAGITGGRAVITTATDVAGITAADELAARQGWRVVNPEAIKAVNAALLAGKRVDLMLPETLFHRYYADRPGAARIAAPTEIAGAAAVLLDAIPPPDCAVPVLRLSSAGYCVGIGCRRGAAAEDIAAGVEQALQRLGIGLDQVAALASIDAKRHEAGLLEYAQRHRLKIRFFPPDELNRYECPHPTPRATAEFGVKGVAEPAAQAAAGGGPLVLTKQKTAATAVAIAVTLKGEQDE